MLQPVDLQGLFTPFQLGGAALRNRIVLPSMGRFVHERGAPGPDVIDYYASRAAGGASLIMTEGVYVDHIASGDNLMMGRFYGARALAAWGKVAQAVHAAGGLAIPQLWHVGLKYSTIDMTSGEVRYRPELGLIGPSGYIEPGKKVCDGMTQEQIDAVIEAFGTGAETAMRLGYDGVEIHGAHGYLIDQFLWAALNRRTDAYGGSPRKRARFAAEIAAECRRRVGPGVPILMRISNWKLVDYGARLADTPQELEELLNPIAEGGCGSFRLLGTAVLDSGVRGQRPQSGRLDQEAHRQTHDDLRLRRSRYRHVAKHGRRPGRRTESRMLRAPHANVRAWRLRPRGRRAAA